MPKKNEIKAFSAEINRIIPLKRLSDRQKTIVHNKLLKLVMDINAADFDMLSYIQVLIEGVVTPPGKKILMEDMDSLQDLKGKKGSHYDPLVEYRILLAYYSSIVEYYVEFRIELICYEINDFAPDSLLLDSMMFEDLFSPKVEASAQPAKKAKKKPSNKYEIKTLKDIKNLENFLKKSIIGQDEAILSVCDAVKLKAAGFSKHVNMMFIGKTGRGKTQLARKLGERFSENFWIINCGEFTHGHEVGRLLGSPPGYIGHAETSMMMEKSEKSKKWTIVFDEIEKAHDKFYNFLLALMDTGRCTDNSGNDVDFTESMFILTSNCGLKDLKSETLSFVQSPSIDGDKEQLTKALINQFSPEFRGRIDETVFFNDLNKDNVRDIVKMNLDKYPVKSTPQLVDYIMSRGYTEEFGARDIERAIKTFLALPIADELLSNRHPEDGTKKYSVDIVDGKLHVIDTAIPI